MVLLWRIADDSPNSPNFPAIQYYDVGSKSGYVYCRSVVLEMPTHTQGLVPKIQ